MQSSIFEKTFDSFLVSLARSPCSLELMEFIRFLRYAKQSKAQSETYVILDALRIVSFMDNFEAKRRGQLLSSYVLFNFDSTATRSEKGDIWMDSACLGLYGGNLIPWNLFLGQVSHAACPPWRSERRAHTRHVFESWL